MPEDDVSCFISSGVCYFDVEILLKLLEGMDETTTYQKHYPGGVEVHWEEPQKDVRYVAGVDTSEGLPGGDNSGIGVLRGDTGAQVASIHGLFNPKELAEHVVRLCGLYNDALVGIERENHGHAVLQEVVRLGYRRPHFRGGPLFYFKRNKADIRESRPGWTTNGETRPIMLSDLADAIENGYIKIHDRMFVSECTSFRRQAGGKFQADSSAHDDSVMKWAIAWQMRQARRPAPRINV